MQAVKAKTSAGFNAVGSSTPPMKTAKPSLKDGFSFQPGIRGTKMNTHIIGNYTPLVYNGHQITVKAEMMSLTDMWKSAGCDEAKRPANWSRKEGAPFIEAASMSLNMPVGHIIKGTRGRTGETTAHWQVGLAYAKYLSPEFHMWCNQVVRERMEGHVVSSALPADVLDQIERNFGISRMLAHKVTGIEGTVRDLANIVASIIPIIQPQQPVIIVHGKTAGEIWNSQNLPKLKNAPTWLGNRLSEMGCQIDTCRKGYLGARSARLFDPDKAEACLRNGLLHKAKVHATERMGQGKLRLVGGAV